MKDKDLLPSKHIVDTSYLDAKKLVTSREEYGIDLVGPTLADQQWQAKAGEGFTSSNFGVDWDQPRLMTPQPN